MRKNLTIAPTLLALIGIAPILSACHTAAGAGEDLTAAGHAITNTAEKPRSVAEMGRLAALLS